MGDLEAVKALRGFNIDDFNAWWEQQEFPGTHIHAAVAAWAHKQEQIDLFIDFVEGVYADIAEIAEK